MEAAKFFAAKQQADIEKAAKREAAMILAQKQAAEAKEAKRIKKE